MTASIDDYAWWDDFAGGQALGEYCLTLVQDLPPETFLARVGAEPQGELAGFDALWAKYWDFQERLDYEWGDFFLVGATTVTGMGKAWTLVVEFNGIVGVEPSLMSPATAGTEAVSHFINANGLGQFCSWKDGVLITGFEWAGHSAGSAPDSLNEAIARIGGMHGGRDKPAEYLALAEELTGVKITPSTLEEAVYTVGIVAMSEQARTSGWSWQDSPEVVAAREAAIRAWATGQGIKVNERGRIPAAIIEAYDDAHR